MLFTLNQPGTYPLTVSYLNNAGDWVEQNEVVYLINFRCNGREISTTGLIPCTYTCDYEASEFGLGGANYNNTSCDCIETHRWSSEEEKCIVKNEILQIIF